MEMGSDITSKLDKTRDMAITFSEIINNLDFQLVMYIQYMDHSLMSQTPTYVALNDVMMDTLLQHTKNSHLIHTLTVSDNDFVDTTHVNCEAKRAIADSIMDEITRILFAHLGIDPWA